MKFNLMNNVSTGTLLFVVGMAGGHGSAHAACVTDPSSRNVTCDGTIAPGATPPGSGFPITIYDQAAAFQPTNGSNSYTPANPAFPAASNPATPGYNPAPGTAIVSVNPGAAINATVSTANISTTLADGGLISANYANAENPAVNNVTVNNFGTIALTSTQTASRASAIVSDSQVNVFTVNNAAGASIVANQAALTNNFNSASLFNTLSTTVAPTPGAYTARYVSPTAAFAIVSALYSDDNTNSFVVNNSGSITATGHFAAAYYGRADTTIVNSGTLGNSDWRPTDRIYDGHWAIATFAGAEFATLAGSNPDTPVYDVRNIAIVNGVRTGTIAVSDTSATTIQNSGTINGDILVLDTNPLITAAAAARGQALPLQTSAGNSGPRDSVVTNTGVINGNFYLGSGDHEIDNAKGATINGAINVDQRPSTGTFAAAVPGTAAGTYASTGAAGCGAVGSNTANVLCAQTQTVLATFVGAQTFKLNNKGALLGDITIIDQAGSVNKITLGGSGFSGNVVAVNGTGSNTLVLNDATSLASVRNFSALALNRSTVTVANGVSLVDGATLRTTIYGAGGTVARPSGAIGTIAGTLQPTGKTTLAPSFDSFVRDGDIYQVAAVYAPAAGGSVSVKQPGSALVTASAETSDGRLLLKTNVRDPRTLSGITLPAGAALEGLVSYSGGDRTVQALGTLVEGLKSEAMVREAGTALAPITNGADVQTPINSANLFGQQIDSRLDGFVYAQIPSSGRSADLGVDRPTPVYGVLPRSGAWIEGIGGGINQSTLNGVAGYNAMLAGVVGGYDRLIVDGLRVGGAFGYIDGTVNDAVNSGTREDIQTFQGLAYASWEQPNYYLRGSAGYGGVHFQSSREITFSTFADIASATHSGDLFTARGELGVPYEYLTSLLVPYAAFTYDRLGQNGYTERSGNGAGFAFGSAVNESERSEIGGKVLVPLNETAMFARLLPSDSIVALEARAAYVHEFGNLGQAVVASFTGGGAPFVAAGPNPDRDMADYGVGLRMGSGPVQIDVSYNGLARSTYLQQIGLLRARYMF